MFSAKVSLNLSDLFIKIQTAVNFQDWIDFEVSERLKLFYFW